MYKIITAVLIALGIGAGGGLYFADGTEVTDTQVEQICEEIQQCKICVTNSINLDEFGIELNVDGTIILDGHEFTKEQILNLKALEIK